MNEMRAIRFHVHSQLLIVVIGNPMGVNVSGFGKLPPVIEGKGHKQLIFEAAPFPTCQNPQ